jgi:hypothetical protein
MNRFLWDLKHAGSPGASVTNTTAGPYVVPGKYAVRLTAGGTTVTRAIDVNIDPRVAADGVTLADLQEQADLLLKLRDAIGDARRARDRLAAAMLKAGVEPSSAPGPGESPSSVRHENPLQALWARLVNAPGAYPQVMLIEQLENVARMLQRADQKPGRDAWERYADLIQQLNAIKSRIETLAP